MNVRSLGLALVAAASAGILCASPARADGPFSVSLGARFPTQGTASQIAGTQTDLGIGYEVGPPPPVPIGITIEADDAFGSSNQGHLNTFGIGATARLKTPVYAGFGVALYSVNVTRTASASSQSVFGAGTTIVVGDRIVSVPGLGLAIEGSYRAIPSAGGVNPSGFGLGLRASI